MPSIYQQKGKQMKILLFILSITIIPTAQAKINQCTDAKGKISYTNRQCEHKQTKQVFELKKHKPSKTRYVSYNRTYTSKTAQKMKLKKIKAANKKRLRKYQHKRDFEHAVFKQKFNDNWGHYQATGIYPVIPYN